MENKQAHAGNELYDENFYRINIENSHKRASVIFPVVTKYIHPRSVIDVGCGVGGWLEYLQKTSKRGGLKFTALTAITSTENGSALTKNFFTPQIWKSA